QRARPRQRRAAARARRGGPGGAPRLPLRRPAHRGDRREPEDRRRAADRGAGGDPGGGGAPARALAARPGRLERRARAARDARRPLRLGPLPGADRGGDRARARAPLRRRLRDRTAVARRRRRGSTLSDAALSSRAGSDRSEGEGDARMRAIRQLRAGLGVLLLAAFACERGSNACDGYMVGDGGAAPKKKWFVGASIDRLSNDYFAKIKQGIEARAQELGLEVSVQDARGDDATQLQQIENFTRQKVDALIVAAVNDDVPALEEAVARARAQGV